jgi:hypothetical protein
LYRHGSLEAPDEPLVRFGRGEQDTKAAMAAQVKGWFQAQRRVPLTEPEAKRATMHESYERDAAITRSVAQRHASGHRGGRGGRPSSASRRKRDNSARRGPNNTTD